MASFFAFVRRQRLLRWITITSTQMLPPFLVSLGQGNFELLQSLVLEESIPTSHLSTLAGLITEGALPLLEEFQMNCLTSE